MKLKSKKAKQNFKEGLTAILISHHINISEEKLHPLLNDFEIYFNNVYRPEENIPFWSDIVSQYLSFYKELTGDNAVFNPIQAINLKRLTKTLQKRYLSKNTAGIWDLNTCITQHLVFYNMVITIPFYRSSFSATIMYSKFDEIASQLAERKKKELLHN